MTATIEIWFSWPIQGFASSSAQQSPYAQHITPAKSPISFYLSIRSFHSRYSLLFFIFVHFIQNDPSTQPSLYYALHPRRSVVCFRQGFRPKYTVCFDPEDRKALRAMSRQFPRKTGLPKSISGPEVLNYANPPARPSAPSQEPTNTMKRLMAIVDIS